MAESFFRKAVNGAAPQNKLAAVPTKLQSRSPVPTAFLGYGSCALAGTCWGTGFYFGKIALTELSVGHMVFYRFAFACLGLLPLLRPARLNRKDWLLLLIASLLGIPLQFLIQFYGLSLTTVSHAALMVGTMPVILAIGATIFTHERLDWKGWLALAGSTTGVALITLSGSRHQHAASGPSFYGDMLIVFSLVIALGWVLLNRDLMHRHAPITVTVYNILIGTAMLAPWVLFRNGAPPIHGLSIKVWLACAAGGLLCTSAATFLWNWGMHHVPASRAGVFLNIEPALGSILGVELLGDKLGPAAWLGGALIITAAIVLTTTGKVEAEMVLE
jgi:drug/metabolite transporter (DMT)-like permease